MMAAWISSCRARRQRQWHQSRAAVCGWLVGLLHWRHGPGGRQDEAGAAGRPAVDAEVDLKNNESGYFLQARLHVSLPGLDSGTARAIVDGAHQACPYSKLTRNNIDVEIHLI
jgi:hypothetical protein